MENVFKIQVSPFSVFKPFLQRLVTTNVEIISAPWNICKTLLLIYPYFTSIRTGVNTFIVVCINNPIPFSTKDNTLSTIAQVSH